MKKWITFLLAFMLVCSLAACGIGTGGNHQNTEEIPVSETEEPVVITDANEILTKVWNQYKIDASEDFHFSIIGGHVESNVLDVPAKFDMELETAQDTLTVAYALTEETVAMTDDIATMMNLMRAYNFTASAVHVTDAANTKNVIANIETAIDETTWMGNVPESYLVVTINDDYVVTAYGNEQIIELFRRAIVKTYESAAEVVAQEMIVR